MKNATVQRVVLTTAAQQVSFIGQGMKILLRPGLANTNPVQIAFNQMDLATDYFTIQTPAANGTIDQIEFPVGLEQPIYVKGSAGEILVIIQIPCGKEAY